MRGASGVGAAAALLCAAADGRSSGSAREHPAARVAAAQQTASRAGPRWRDVGASVLRVAFGLFNAATANRSLAPAPISLSYRLVLRRRRKTPRSCGSAVASPQHPRNVMAATRFADSLRITTGALEEALEPAPSHASASDASPKRSLRIGRPPGARTRPCRPAIANRLGWLTSPDVDGGRGPAAHGVRGVGDVGTGSRTWSCSEWVVRALRQRCCAPSSASAPGGPGSRWWTRSTPITCRRSSPTPTTPCMSWLASRDRPSNRTCWRPTSASDCSTPASRGGRPTSWPSPTLAPRWTRARPTEGFRDVFRNPPDIGGRYSAISFFGLVPAALMGCDVARLVGDARAMLDAGRAPDRSLQPGARRSAPLPAPARLRAATSSR